MLKKFFIPIAAACLGIPGAAPANSGSWMPNYDESKVLSYTLPELMKCKNGKVVTTVKEWESIRRSEILADYTKIMYGKFPEKAEKVEYELLSEKKGAVNGKAIRREIRLYFTGKNQQKFHFDILLYLPEKVSGKVPVFAGLNFKGNHTVENDPELRLSGLKFDPTPAGVSAARKKRGSRIHRFPLETIIDRGYALATACYHDIFPDRKDGWQDSIYTLFYSKEELIKNPPHEKHSAIGAWSWGLRRIMDYLERVPEIDSGRAVVFGHSRLGKTALWTGANDARFKLVCVNDAGEGGSALARRNFGETLYSMCFIRKAMGNYWFVSGVKPYADKVVQLPFDQHMLIALAAPRAIAVHSATEDLWADPKGEYLSAYHAGKVFELYGKEPLKSAEMPPPETPVGSDVSYFLRTGKHDILLSDWQHYLDMADRLFK